MYAGRGSTNSKAAGHADNQRLCLNSQTMPSVSGTSMSGLSNRILGRNPDRPRHHTPALQPAAAFFAASDMCVRSMLQAGRSSTDQGITGSGVVHLVHLVRE